MTSPVADPTEIKKTWKQLSNHIHSSSTKYNKLTKTEQAEADVIFKKVTEEKDVLCGTVPVWIPVNSGLKKKKKKTKKKTKKMKGGSEVGSKLTDVQREEMRVFQSVLPSLPLERMQVGKYYDITNVQKAYHQYLKSIRFLVTRIKGNTASATFYIINNDDTHDTKKSSFPIDKFDNPIFMGELQSKEDFVSGHVPPVPISKLSDTQSAPF